MKTICIYVMFFLISFMSSGSMKAQIVKDKEGNTYKTVTIGSQTWMGENLKSLRYSDSTLINYVWSYNGSDSLASIYGRLYSWDAAMRGASSSNSVPSGVKGVCPDGWHLPSEAEWMILIDYCGGMFEAGGLLKEAGTLHWQQPNTGATNQTGFTALPGGRSDNATGSLLGETGFWLTSKKENDFVYYIVMGNKVPYASSIGDGIPPADINKSGFSVRCLKDTPTGIVNVSASKQLKVYPNPAADKITIQTENICNDYLTIYNITGDIMLKKMINQNENTIDISDLADGVYIVTIHCVTGIMQKEIIKCTAGY